MTEEILDIRPVAPPEKHPTIFRRLDALAPGDALLLVNDHDPRPLRYQLDIERPGRFEWDYLAAGPVEWKVRITRTDSIS